MVSMRFHHDTGKIPSINPWKGGKSEIVVPIGFSYYLSLGDSAETHGPFQSTGFNPIAMT